MADLLTAREIAEKTKFTRAYIDYVLKGERTPSPSAAAKFEEATGVTRLAWMYPEYINPYLATTSRAGTKRLALALKEASKTADVLVKQEICAAGTLARNLSGKVTTISEFCENFNLSDASRNAIFAVVKSERLANDKFQFDIGEFHIHFSYKSIELNNGAILTAPLERFDQCFQKEEADGSQGAYVYKTEGIIIDERLRKTK